MKKMIFTGIVSVFFLLTLNACSTIEGAGKDLKGLGQSIESEASRAKGYKK